jgi:hypothetical protein
MVRIFNRLVSASDPLGPLAFVASLVSAYSASRLD